MAEPTVPTQVTQSKDEQVTELTTLIVVALASALAPLNSTMIAVALPAIMNEFGVNVVSASWLATAYLIAMASLQPVAGKLGDRFGRRPLILGGLLYFCLASLGAALAPTFPLLLFLRIQQGISGAIVFPNGSALLRQVVPAERRAGRFGLMGAAISVAAVTGPTLGGLLVGTVGWQAIFYVNLPIILPALLLGLKHLPQLKPHPVQSRFDMLGAISLSVLLIGAAWLLTQSRRGNTQLLIPGGVVVLLAALAFIRYELGHRDPMLQPRLFHHRTFAAACGVILFGNLAMYSLFLALPILLSQQMGWAETQIGLILTAMSGGSVIFTPLGGRLADRFGRRWPTLCGYGLMTLGLLILVLNRDTIGLSVLVASQGIMGIGLGIAGPGLQTAAIESVPAAEAGVASGVYMTSRYLGSIIGSSVLAALIGSSAGNVDGYGVVFIMVVVAAFVATLLSSRLEHRPELTA